MDHSALVSFYRGEGVDHAGRRLGEILAWDHRRLEMVHDYIQWLFPLPEPSRFNPDAPLLSAADIAVFRGDERIRTRVLAALDLLLDFLGLARAGDEIARAPDFERRAANWLQPANHNHLRLTRIMLFLRAAGFETLASALGRCLADIAGREGRGVISDRTLAFWRAAAHGAPGLS